MIPYTTAFPHHVQVHRDAFSYGDVGPRADSRIVVDLRFFGKQDIDVNNQVYFGKKATPMQSWEAGVYDMYGMPQATVRSFALSHKFCGVLMSLALFSDTV